MLRSDTRIVETGGYRVGLVNLSVVILQQWRHRTVENSNGVRGQRGTVRLAVTTCFDTEQSDLIVIDEATEHADGIGTTPDTSHHGVW